MKKLLFGLAVGMSAIACQTEQKEEVTKGMKSNTDKAGNQYSYVENDPMKVRIYELDNGLKLYLSQNKNEPNFSSMITVKAGSTYDPADNTGLAHYLEHLMFKGTERLGTVNWEKEKVLLEQIEELYEAHKAATTETDKKSIYKKIDSLSFQAAKYASPNEFDKAISNIGGKNTNAFTSNEVTAYVNVIPANELEKWVILEKERFGSLVLRLFHTELETVYEEFNRGQDSDRRKAYYALLESLYKGHPYGDQTTIGKAAHLKNPSMKNIRTYWEKYYVPNNMAIVLSGDIEFEKTVELFQKYWGNFKAAKDLKHPEFEPLQPITQPVERHVYGADKEFVTLAYRLDGNTSKDADYGLLVANLLSNGKAGLIDLNLVQQQKVLGAYAYSNFLNDYGNLSLQATLREGQTMKDAKTLLLEQIERIKKGQFDDKMFKAIINNLRKNEIEENEGNGRVYKMMSSFVSGDSWDNTVHQLNRLDAITKEDLVRFANETFKENYVVVYKHLGQDSNIVKVEKPEITAIDLNSDTVSSFLETFKAIGSPELTPVYIDFSKDIQQGHIHDNIPFHYIKNEDNELFKLMYVLELGTNHDLEAALAYDYLPYLGTSKYTAAELQNELYNNGLAFGVYAGYERTYVFMSGLKKSTQKGIELLEHILSDAQPDSTAYKAFAEGVIKKRKDAKLEKSMIQYRYLPYYAKYGVKNPVTHILSAEDLQQMAPDKLTQKIHATNSMEHTIFYYGQDDLDVVKKWLEAKHPKYESLQAIPSPIALQERTTDENQIYFVHRDQVQADIIFLSKNGTFDINLLPVASWFNGYYGSGLSSVFFQEIREAKGLAYTAYCRFTTPDQADRSHYLQGYIGTQPDKLKDALHSAFELLDEMPVIDNQIEESRNSILKRIASDRKIKDQKFFFYLANKKKGIEYDHRKNTYDYLLQSSPEDLSQFFSQYIKGRKYSIMIMGNKKDIDLNNLKEFGKVQEISLEELFGY